jgi:uncharacterized protein YjcR
MSSTILSSLVEGPGVGEEHRPMSPHMNGRCEPARKKERAERAPCRMHGAGGGAPEGNRNALKHGHYTAEALALKRHITALTRLARETMAGIE